MTGEPGGPGLGALEAEAREREEMTEGRRAMGRLVAVALVAGLVTGLVCGLFRLVLRWADHARIDVMREVRPLGVAGWLIPVVGVAACAAAARALVRLAPEAGGSGVQQVEAVMRGEAAPARPRVLPVKFVGGSFALGSGMVLGREGPSVQMGAVIGGWLSARDGMAEVDVRRLQAAAAGAGLGAAFGAPLGGLVFTLEEVARSVTVRIVTAALVASAASIAVAWTIVGRAPVYAVSSPPVPSWRVAVPVLLFGAVLGALGVAYNRLIVWFLDAAERLAGVAPEIRAAVVGGIVGACLRVEVSWVGGGDALSDRVLADARPGLALAGLLLLRCALGPLSFAAGTPGGIFAPLLLVGALAGGLFAHVADALWPALSLDPVAFAIIGMSTFFAAVVRAPVTGVVLIVEMTATTSQALPMLGAAAAAVVVATLLRGMPIYDTLRLRMLRSQESGNAGAPASQPAAR